MSDGIHRNYCYCRTLLSLLLLIKVFSLQGRLNDLKEDLERLQSISGVPQTSRIFTAPAAPQTVQSPGSGHELDDRLRFLTAEGKKIQAIKELREATNASLKEAKDYVDALERR